MSHETAFIAQRNKQLMQSIFAELAVGNGKPFVAAMADDFSWTIPGQSTWSRTWRGKQAVIDELMRPLFARFATTYTSEAVRFVAEDDLVVVECRGKVTTRSGKPYNNHYCYVCRLADGQLRELTEYMDTELAASALGRPDQVHSVSRHPSTSAPGVVSEPSCRSL